MKVGITGLPGSGKTTVFQALTRCKVNIQPFGSTKPNVGVVNVPDERVDYFAKQYNPKKITYAPIEFTDPASKISVASAGVKFGAEFFSDIKKSDAIVVIVRGFENEIGETPDPVSDLSSVTEEILLADLTLIDTRKERVEKQLHAAKKGSVNTAGWELDLLNRLQKCLDEGNKLNSLDYTKDELIVVRNYDFLTFREIIAVLNVSEDELSQPTEITDKFNSFCEENNIPHIVLCGSIEKEVSELSDEEEKEFLSDYGIENPARNVLIQKTYDTLGLISFITAGEPEVRAWTIRKGDTALDAAAAIHTDIAKGFIRAEVANFTEILPVGTWEKAKTEGIVKLQGKEYIMQDGDVVFIRNKS